MTFIIFDKNVVKYTTIVRTGFEEFEDEELCEEDREKKVEQTELSGSCVPPRSLSFA